MGGLLRRLFTRAPSAPPVVQPNVFPGDVALDVVGESLRQDALWKIVGGFRHTPVRHRIIAELEPEPDNPADPNAIRVVVEAKHVGYLPRDKAANYLPGLLRLRASC